MTAILIPPSELPQVWESVRPWISAACGYNDNRYTVDDALHEIENNEKQLWVVKSNNTLSGVFITALMNFPQKKCCIIDICTGENFSEWAHLIVNVENWARAQNCKQMFLIARLGMEKLLKNHGYSKTHAVFEKEL